MSSLGQISLDQLDRVIRTDELAQRIGRPPDHASEARALRRLGLVLAREPHRILDELVETALELCRAGSTGISILDSETGGDPEQFRWRALAGVWKSKYFHSLLPRHFSPCGVVIDRRAPQLMDRLPLAYPYIADIDPPCFEVLLVPFYSGLVPVGTIWAAMHDEDRHFDAEDRRLLSSLADFTSGAYQVVKSLQSLQAYATERAQEVSRLTESQRLRDEFLATIAHELRNPLGPLRTSAATLALHAHDERLVKRASGIIQRQVSMMARLINDLMDVSRVRLGVLELDKTSLNLIDVVRNAVDESPLATDPTRQLEISLPDEPLLVCGDAMRLVQVIQNLLTNAFKYTEVGGRIAIRAARDAADALVGVTDDGIGIPAEQMESIFDLFAQAGERGSPRSQGGLGIGLHLARRLVEAHGGTLTAYSGGRGCGSRFVMRVPLIL